MSRLSVGLVNMAAESVNHNNDTSLKINNYNELYTTKKGVEVATFTLRLDSSKHRYHRLSWGGPWGQHPRRLNAVCYHGHYAFLHKLFSLADELKIVCSIESSAPFSGHKRNKIKYTSLDDFLDKAPDYNPNVGGTMVWEEYQNLCECNE